MIKDGKGVMKTINTLTLISGKGHTCSCFIATNSLKNQSTLAVLRYVLHALVWNLIMEELDYSLALSQDLCKRKIYLI